MSQPACFSLWATNVCLSYTRLMSQSYYLPDPCQHNVQPSLRRADEGLVLGLLWSGAARMIYPGLPLQPPVQMPCVRACRVSGSPPTWGFSLVPSGHSPRPHGRVLTLGGAVGPGPLAQLRKGCSVACAPLTCSLDKYSARISTLLGPSPLPELGLNVTNSCHTRLNRGS